MEKKNKKISRRNVLAIGILAALVIPLGAVVSGVSAKYMKKVDDQTTVVRAREFYFTSDLLKENGAVYPLNPGTDTISFEVRNYADDLRYSEGQITFTVEAGGATVTVEPEGNTLPGAQKSSAVVTLSDLEDGRTYTVRVVGSGGYQKQLSAEFEILAPGTQVYKYLQMDPSGAFVLLTVWTENVSGNVAISAPAGLIPDATDGMLAGIRNYNAGQGKYQAMANQNAGTLGAYSSHTYRFFLETPFAEYNVDGFEVTVGDTAATEKTPN